MIGLSCNKGVKEMKISVSDAKAQLTQLVRRAEADEDIVLIHHGHDVIRLAPIREPVAASAKRHLLSEIRAAVAAKAAPGPNAARSQDFLYGDEACPNERFNVVVVDTTALMAVVLDEPDAERCSRELENASEIAISAATVAEASIVAAMRKVGPEMQRLIDELGFEITPVTPATAQRAARAYERCPGNVESTSTRPAVSAGTRRAKTCA